MSGYIERHSRCASRVSRCSDVPWDERPTVSRYIERHSRCGSRVSRCSGLSWDEHPTVCGFYERCCRCGLRVSRCAERVSRCSVLPWDERPTVCRYIERASRSSERHPRHLPPPYTVRKSADLNRKTRRREGLEDSPLPLFLSISGVPITEPASDRASLASRPGSATLAPALRRPRPRTSPPHRSHRGSLGMSFRCLGRRWPSSPPGCCGSDDTAPERRRLPEEAPPA